MIFFDFEVFKFDWPVVQHGYDEQLMRPHRIIPRHKGDTIKGARV